MADEWVDLPFDEAVDFLLEKEVVTRAEFDAIFEWGRNRAFVVTGVTKLDVLQTVLEDLADSIREGGTLGEFADALDATFESAGIDLLSPWRAETVFRTNIQSAYGKGLWEQGTEGPDADEIWGWRYHAIKDDRVRDEHLELDGATFETGDGDVFFPPWGFNCRCDAEWITNAEAEEEGLTSTSVSNDVRETLFEEDFTSPAVGDDFEPDLSDYHPAMAADYETDSPED